MCSPLFYNKKKQLPGTIVFDNKILQTKIIGNKIESLELGGNHKGEEEVEIRIMVSNVVIVTNEITLMMNVLRNMDSLHGINTR